MREGACQSQRGKREAGFKFDSKRGRIFLGQMEKWKMRLGFDFVKGKAYLSQRKEQKTGRKNDTGYGLERIQTRKRI